MTKHSSASALHVAYFSMEFAVDHRIPNYAGGLGVLAADYMFSIADMQYNAAGVSLIYHQDSNPDMAFYPESFMKRLPQTVLVDIEGRGVHVGVYQYDVVSPLHGKTKPIYFLTTNIPENKEWDRDITKNLYPSDGYTRLAQEAILGIGGVRILRALGYETIDTFHLNEGHAALLTLEVLRENHYQDAQVKEQCCFTTHTPVAAGHDYFDYSEAYRVIGNMMPWHIRDIATHDRLSMTHLALNLSRKTNSVSEKHRRVCEEMFGGYSFKNVTNGVHHIRWASIWMQKLFDSYLPGWREDPSMFRLAAENLPDEDLWTAHQKSKKECIDWINAFPGCLQYEGEGDDDDYFDTHTLTIGFARRFVPYKRPALIFRDLDRLRKLGYRKLQLVFAGNCHPSDEFCVMKRDAIRHFAQEMRGQVRIAVLPEYNTFISKKMVTGCDIWLNNPIIPREASGTSGMKVALNGGINLSIRDGWWEEAIGMKPNSGWGFGSDSRVDMSDFERNRLDSLELYDALQEALSCYGQQDKTQWISKMKESISLLAFFNSNRAIEEYDLKMWKR